MGQNVNIMDSPLVKVMQEISNVITLYWWSMSHGSKSHRLQGSIGAGTTPGRVLPGKKMAGRMVGTQTLYKGLRNY